MGVHPVSQRAEMRKALYADELGCWLRSGAILIRIADERAPLSYIRDGLLQEASYLRRQGPVLRGL